LDVVNLLVVVNRFVPCLFDDVNHFLACLSQLQRKRTIAAAYNSPALNESSLLQTPDRSGTSRMLRSGKRLTPALVPPAKIPGNETREILTMILTSVFVEIINDIQKVYLQWR
jgi:hypothetical protein